MAQQEMSVQFKSCPRCLGDMLRERIRNEVDLVCLACGHRVYIESKPDLREELMDSLRFVFQREK